jgi:small subunit ribosomal protein S18
MAYESEDRSPDLNSDLPMRRQNGQRRRIAQRLGRKPNEPFDYKDPGTLKYFLSERGKILPRRMSGLSAREQRDLRIAIARARHMALLPYTSTK